MGHIYKKVCRRSRLKKMSHSWKNGLHLKNVSPLDKWVTLKVAYYSFDGV